jgi:hypothetical protein
MEILETVPIGEFLQTSLTSTAVGRTEARNLFGQDRAPETACSLGAQIEHWASPKHVKGQGPR